MLETIQIITLLQGFFLILILIKRKQEFKSVNFWLLIGTILSVQLYALGDDDFNLLVENADWYFFYDFLFITFLFLLIKYRFSNAVVFNKKDALFFIPYLVFVSAQYIDGYWPINRTIRLVVGMGISIAVFGYLIYILRKIWEHKAKWMFYFIIPYTLMFIADRIGNIVTNSYDSIPFLESYGIIGLSAVLLYIILYRLIMSPDSVIPKVEVEKYKSSSLDQKLVSNYKKQLKQLFEVDKVFIDNKLTVNDVAGKMQIPRQHLSEILSMHLNTNFQDYLNKYRVEEFIQHLNNPDYNNLTLLGIAKEVGFNSKTSFYTTFKKVTGMTPSEYKKKIQSEEEG